MKLTAVAIVLTVLGAPIARAQTTPQVERAPSAPAAAGETQQPTATTVAPSTVITGDQAAPAAPPPAPPAAPPPVAPAPAPTYYPLVAQAPSHPRDVPPRPPSGTGLIVAGWIVTGIGGLNLITAPLCLTEGFEDADVDEICLGLSLGVGAIGLVVGIPMIVTGNARRAKVIEWRERYGVAGAFLQHARLSAHPRGAQLGFHTEF